MQPCLFKIALVGIDGALLGADTGQVLPGEGAVFDYDLAKAAGLRDRERLQFHADVWVEHPAEVGAMVEVVDLATGNTAFSSSPCLMPLPEQGQ